MILGPDFEGISAPTISRCGWRAVHGNPPANGVDSQSCPTYSRSTQAPIGHLRRLRTALRRAPASEQC